jgi:acetyl esterase/lipase
VILDLPVGEITIPNRGSPIVFRPSQLTSLFSAPSSCDAKDPLAEDSSDFLHISPGDVPSIPKFSSVRALFVSRYRRRGMESILKRHNLPSANLRRPTRTLLIHFHGGGFIAGSPHSHEFYLRSWAKEFKKPILSVDYSLAPDVKFPQALQECVYAYAWALANADLLGTTAEFVYFVGDSAGGNLTVATALLAAQLVRPLFSSFKLCHLIS